ncbi:MAG: hypothetical protein RIF32_19340 [Leptospirales bacterium]
MEWQTPTDQPERFGYREEGRSTGAGCLLVIMGLFTGVFLLIGMSLVVLVEDWSLKAMGAFAAVIGGVGVYSVIGHWKRDCRRAMFFDSRAREFRLQSALTNQQDFIVAYDRMDRLHMYRLHRSGSDSTTRYTVYVLALVLNDGSELALESGGSAESIAELARRLADSTGLGVTSPAELKFTVPETRETTRPPPGAPRFATTASPHVRERSTTEGREVRVATAKMTTSAKVINALVLGLFLAVPVFILAQSFDLIFTIFAGLFVILFYSVVVLVILMQLRRFAVLLSRDRLVVRIEFPLPLLKALNQSIEIPAGQIQAVQINLSEEGHFWLALSVSPEFELPQVSQFLANIGPYAKGLRTGPGDERRLSLWEINAFQAPGAGGASAEDLEYVAAMIREEIGLRTATGAGE